MSIDRHYTKKRYAHNTSPRIMRLKNLRGLFVKKILTLLTAVIIIIFDILPVSADPVSYPVIVSEAAVLMDAKTGQVLFEKNMHEQLYPASITKIMTALLGLENGNLNDIITMSHEAVFSIEKGSSHIALDTGEQITLEQALMAAMLPSANEASNGIAEYVGGTIPEFVKLMNQRAIEAGALHTNFHNANGLPDKEHVTTAYDMAMITKAALMNDEFCRIFGTLKYEIPPTNKQPETRYLYAEHKMLPSGRFEYEGVIGGKTGYTGDAQCTLVTVAQRGNRELIAVVLKSLGYGVYNDTKTLLDYGFDEFYTTQIVLPAATADNMSDSPENLEKAQSIIDQYQDAAYTRLMHKNLNPSDIAIDYSVADDPVSSNIQLKINMYLKDYNSYMSSDLGTIILEQSPPVPSISIWRKLLNIVLITLKIIAAIIVILVVVLLLLKWVITMKNKRRRRLRNLNTRRNQETILYYYDPNKYYD